MEPTGRRICLAISLLVLSCALGCPSDEPPDEPFTPVDVDGLAVYAGLDRWVGQGEEVTLEGIAVGDVTSVGWDMDGDGVFEVEGAEATVVADASEETELVFRAIDAAGAEDLDTLVVHVSPPGENVLTTCPWTSLPTRPCSASSARRRFSCATR